MSINNNRIGLGDSTMNAVAKMTEGNFGAMDALMKLLSSDHVDPDNFLGGIGVMLYLDTLQIYGTDIFVLYSDICDKDIVKMIAVLIAVQLNFFSYEILQDACSRQDFSGRDLVPVNQLYEKVKERLPKFNTHVKQ